MPNYGEAKYWDERYETDKDDPFDWLFEYDELGDILDMIYPDKSLRTLVVGSGNAPFSPDLSRKGGFTGLVNIDISKVVTDQQAAKFPEQQWLVMDVTQMTFPDGSFPSVIDKSLIDTLLCCSNSAKRVDAMLKEIDRVLAPGGRYVTFSLHSVDEILPKFESMESRWRIREFRVKSSRWNETEHRKRAVAHSMIICDKPVNGSYKNDSLDEDLYSLPTVITEEAYYELKDKADEVNLKAGLQAATIDQLRYLLLDILGRRQPQSKFHYRDPEEEDQSLIHDGERLTAYMKSLVPGLTQQLRQLAGRT